MWRPGNLATGLTEVILHNSMHTLKKFDRVTFFFCLLVECIKHNTPSLHKGWKVRMRPWRVIWNIFCNLWLFFFYTVVVVAIFHFIFFRLFMYAFSTQID